MQKLKEKNNSFIRTIASAVLLYMILMIIILSAIWWNTRNTLESAAGATLSQAKEISDYEIEEVLKANEQALAVVLQDNADISAFKNGTDVQKAIAQQNMLQTIWKIVNREIIIQDRLSFMQIIVHIVMRQIRELLYPLLMIQGMYL